MRLELAGRRLDEAASLTGLDKPALAAQALDGYATQLEVQLEYLQDTSPLKANERLVFANQVVTYRTAHLALLESMIQKAGPEEKAHLQSILVVSRQVWSRADEVAGPSGETHTFPSPEHTYTPALPGPTPEETPTPRRPDIRQQTPNATASRSPGVAVTRVRPTQPPATPRPDKPSPYPSCVPNLSGTPPVTGLPTCYPKLTQWASPTRPANWPTRTAYPSRTPYPTRTPLPLIATLKATYTPPAYPSPWHWRFP